MSKIEQMLKAQVLRKRGWSIPRVAKHLRVSKSSASLWCRKITLTKKQQDVLRKNAIAAGAPGRLLGSQKNHERKMERIARHLQQGQTYVQSLGKREFLLVGAALYWAEGTKKGQLSFINSDQDMILFMYQWFQVALGIQRKAVMPRIFINELHRSRSRIIEKYWSTLLNLPPEQFGKIVFIKRKQKKRYENHDTYYGLLALRVRNSTDLKYKILGLIEALKCSTF